MAVVALEHVSKRYRQKEAEHSALEDVSLTIEKHELVVVTGISGSGKTTLACILGLLDVPDSGSYHLNQTEVSNTNESERAAWRREHIGWIFPDFKLIPDMSVRDNVKVAMAYDGVKGKDRTFQVNRLLKQTGLKDYAKKRVNTLANIHKQRLAVARALANKPSLIVADEPTSRLDGDTAKLFTKTLSKLCRQGYAVVMTTDNPDLAECATRQLYLHDGMLSHTRQPARTVEGVA